MPCRQWEAENMCPLEFSLVVYLSLLFYRKRRSQWYHIQKVKSETRGSNGMKGKKLQMCSQPFLSFQKNYYTSRSFTGFGTGYFTWKLLESGENDLTGDPNMAQRGITDPIS